MSYSHGDSAWRDALRQMLRPALECLNGAVGGQTHPSGDDWDPESNDALRTAILVGAWWRPPTASRSSSVSGRCRPSSTLA